MDARQANEEAELRPLMFSIAYRMTGSVTEAEDLVQEAFFRLERARQRGVVVESPKAYLAAATTRLTIDHLRSARARRESYVGTWLPEPIVVDLHGDPEQMADLSDYLSMAFLVLLESLSPVERAVYLLREAFDFSYEDIAQIVEKSEANCRQIFRRARQHIGADEARYEASTEHSEALLRSFLSAASGGDFDQLVDLLAADAVFCGDGGGTAVTVGQPLYGCETVAISVLAVFDRLERRGLSVEPVRVNGGPGIITHDPQRNVVGVLSLEVLDGVIQTVRSITNPDKLGHLGTVSDVLRLPGADRNHQPWD
jgi:RNA polymerase sigma-70 factor (TIGR02957 family)